LGITGGRMSKVIEVKPDEKDAEASDAWFWVGYLKDKETEPEWVKEAVEKGKKKKR
jgi:hypothetical protein